MPAATAAPAEAPAFQKTETHLILPADSNQALGIARYAIDFVRNGQCSPAASVLERTNMFHVDATFCGLSAIALGTNAPAVLRAEALEYADAKGATIFGDKTRARAHGGRVRAQ
jgi:2-methylcitrate dehydratase